jgi:hypothetical protein
MPVKTGFYVRVQNGQVTDVWDTPGPQGQDGWSDAVEVTPDLVENREIMGTHTIDITKNPIEIVWSKVELTVDDRKGALIGQAGFPVFLLQQQLEVATAANNTETIASLNTQIQEATATRDARIVLINAATTHEDVDALL